MALRLLASFLCISVTAAMFGSPGRGAGGAGAGAGPGGFGAKSLLASITRGQGGTGRGMGRNSVQRRPNFFRNAMLTRAMGGDSKDMAYLNAAQVFGRASAMDRMLKLHNFPSYHMLPSLAGNPALPKARRYINTVGTMDRLGNDAGQRMYALRLLMSPATDPVVGKMVLLDAMRGKYGDQIERMAMMRTVGGMAGAGASPASSLAATTLLN